MKVNINDKLSKLKQIYEGFQVDGKYLCGGKLLENMDDTTFAKSFILNNSTVMVMSQDGCSGTAKMWQRFK